MQHKNFQHVYIKNNPPEWFETTHPLENRARSTRENSRNKKIKERSPPSRAVDQTQHLPAGVVIPFAPSLHPCERATRLTRKKKIQGGDDEAPLAV